MRFFAVALTFFGAAASYAQAPEVPHKIQFAGMTLTIRDDARREIQTDVDALTRSPRHFNIKLERAKTYFPIIEKIFAEERLPDDFKYLVLQESALIPDAVSVSNAVGFWQFKDATAIEMGMRVDKQIDERMNLASATRGAARYLKKNNLYFNNWLYALQSYQMGAGGVQRSVDNVHNGAKHMEVNSETYWYVKKYLAHKIAFEGSLKGEPQVKVTDYAIHEATTTKAIAARFAIDEARLLEYNKWILKETIPDDKKYTLLVPVGEAKADLSALAASTKPEKSVPASRESQVKKDFVNGIPAVRALNGETVVALAARVHIDLSDLLKYNDIAIDHQVKPNAYYFIGRKNTKAEKTFHQLAKGESLWSVSQQYGVQLKKLRKYNRLKSGESLPAGATVWLSSKMPRKKEISDSEAVGISGETFEWQIGKSGSKVTTVAVPEEHTSAEEPTQPEVADAMPRTTEPAPLASATGMPTVAKSAPAIIHEVKASDTLYSVARQYGVTIKDLMEWNEKTSFSVSIGEKLRVSQK